MAALDAFAHRLESGDLVGVLDPDKRTVLIKEAESYKWQLQQSSQHDADKREKTAERAVSAAVRQIESAVPLSIDAWDDLRAKVQGTPFAADFNALVTQEREAQKVLRLPAGEQEQYVQQREAALAQKGGTMVDRANLQRIRTAIDTNRKELEQAPLLAAQRLYGKQMEPLNLGDLLQAGGTHRAAEIFADRSVTLQAMAKQYGPSVRQRPLLPQEQSALVSMVEAAGPSQATQLFGALRAAIDDDDTYRAAMQQIAPDSPVKARAGLLAAAGKSITLQDNLIAGDVRVPSGKVAQTMLAGEALINRSKRQKSEDGQARTLFAPPREQFAEAFSAVVGNLYRGRPAAQEGDLQAAYAYYTGKAAETGQLADGGIDSKLAKEAATATLGDLVDFNGRGTVKAPLGMTADQFKTRMSERFAELVTTEKLPASVLGFYSHYGALNYGRDGTYVLTLGDAPVINPRTGRPVVIDLEPPPASGARYRSSVDLIPGQPQEGGKR
ncbi:MAG: hypothetical protein EOP40_16975 [Rubrivivax sp.]|nr:MAG: hypothetical protein EOP40_16975 [Rubrivivax sp.]